MSTTVELGQLVLSYPKAELRLEIVASITTELSQDSVNLQWNSSEYISNLLTSKSAWVCRGSGLHLVTQVKIDGQPLRTVESEILSRSLTNADLWGQLHLHASLPTNHLDTAHSLYKSGRVQLKLSHTSTNPDVEEKRSHRLSFDVPFADVKPPDGVPVCTLRVIRLSIEISRTNQPPRSKKARCPIERENKGEGKGDKTAFLQDGWYLQGLQELSQPCSWPGDMILLSGRSDPTKATFIQLGDKKEVPIFTPNDLTRTSCLRKRSAESALHEVNSTVDSTVEQHLELNFGQIMELLDAAVRMTICRNPLKISSGVKVKASSFGARLAEIAPSLWSPDYLPAVSQRACLTPIISRALCHSFLKTRSLSLKCKMEELAARGLRQSNIRPDIPSNAPGTFKNVHMMNQLLAAKLWGFIQSTLFDPSAARRLKPLWQPGARVSGAIKSDEILEEQNIQGLEGGSEPYFESGDVLESVDDYADNDSDGELLMASSDARIPNIEMRRYGDLEVDFDYVHAGGLSQNQGLAAGTLQHSNVGNELSVSFLENTCLGGLEGRAITNDDYGDVNEYFEPLDHVIVCSPFDSGLLELDKQKGEDLLEECVAKSRSPRC